MVTKISLLFFFLNSDRKYILYVGLFGLVTETCLSFSHLG